ncbi:MAG: hypothetical protein ICV76_06125 [Nitrospiraceae bacterium]|nr:hypothetical protein [Nitrospiraceae bacterium]
MVVFLLPLVAACAPSVRWVHDSPADPSCMPDRLLSWNDFKQRSGHGRRGAETAIRFHLRQGDPPRILLQFDRESSWVRPEVVHAPPKQSDRLLRHEQLHFAISCLLTREANVALRSGGDPRAMMLLLNAVATRINVQYDVETNHGLNAEQQEQWEKTIQSSLTAGPIGKTAGLTEK